MVTRKLVGHLLEYIEVMWGGIFRIWTGWIRG